MPAMSVRRPRTVPSITRTGRTALATTGVQVSGHAPAYSNGTQQAASLVSQACSTSFLRPSCRYDQPVAADDCTDTMEAGVHPAGTWDADAETTGGLPADFHNAGAHSHDRENCSPMLHLPSIVVTSSYAAVQWEVRIPTDWLDHCCNHSSPQHRRQPALHWTICHRHITGLLKSIWHSTTLNITM